MEVLNLLLKGGLIAGVCYATTVIGKCIVAAIISKNNDMSDEKVKSITKMMSKDINVKLH